MRREISPKYFPAFLAVVESESFSAAASKAYMTQANVSKHIHALEEQIGQILFIRTTKSPIITEAGKCLLEYIRTIEQLNAELLQKINHSQETMCGVVKYAMLHPRMMYSSLEKLREYWHLLKDVEIDVFIESEQRIIEQVLEGSLDFGLVESHFEQPRLHYVPFGSEEYVLVGKEQGALSIIETIDDLMSAKFLYYPGMSEYFDGWSNFHFKNDHEAINSSSLSYSGRTNNIDSAILMLMSNTGISVFPRNYVDELLKEGKLYEWPKGKAKKFYKEVYLVSLQDDLISRRASIVMDFFKKALKATAVEGLKKVS